MKPLVLKSARGLRASDSLVHEMDIALTLQELCGATGYRIENGMLLALRFDDAGNEVVIERFAIEWVGPS